MSNDHRNPVEKVDPPVDTRAKLRNHRLMLVVVTIVVALSFLLQVRPDQRVEFRWWPDLPLPHLCISRTAFGVECPGCGLTRSFIHLAGGRWRESFEIHRVGWVLALAVLAQFPYRLYRIWHDRHTQPSNSRFPMLFGNGLVVLLIANWLADIIF